MEPTGHMDPMGAMGDIERPVEGAHSRSRTKEEREPIKPLTEEQRLRVLEGELNLLKAKLDNLQGKDGVVVTDGIISLDARAVAAAAGVGGARGSVKRMFINDVGVSTPYNFKIE